MAGPIDAKHLDLVGMHLADEKKVAVNDNLLRAAAADDFLIGTIVAEIGDLSWDRRMDLSRSKSTYRCTN
jgi:hypothetical protein